MIQAPPILENLLAGTKLITGLSESTIIADFDFETYSPAGFIWCNKTDRWLAPPNCKDKGLPTVGVLQYTEHPEAEVLCMAYDLKDGKGKRLWKPNIVDNSLPDDFYLHVTQGKLLEAWNCNFEYWVWNNICVPKYGWPVLALSQLRDAMAKARAFALPGSLDAVSKVLNLKNKKNLDGKRLLNKFSIPHTPSKKDPRLRILPGVDEAEDTQKLYNYNLMDIAAEAEASSLIPDLSTDELAFWLCDQQVNVRGVQIDIESIKSCIAILIKAHVKYNHEINILTEGVVESGTKVQRLLKWVQSKGLTDCKSLAAKTLDQLIKTENLDPSIKRALEIRSMLGSAAVKKLYKMLNQISKKGRLHNLFIYHAARTGRASGAEVQPQNLPNSGPIVKKCIPTLEGRTGKAYVSCGKFYNADLLYCPWCTTGGWKKMEWNAEVVEETLKAIKTQSLECVEFYYGDALEIISGCLRGMFIAAPGHDLICSDYKAIEAVVLAALAGEQWRLDVFKSHGKIYEMSASKISGVPFEDFEKHYATTGQHHPLRKKIGKVAELASGYQGWISAWENFGADEFFTKEEMKVAILAWRESSPMIVKMWSGIENSAKAAVTNPGHPYAYRGIKYLVQNDILYCQLLSGRFITYHKPKLMPDAFRNGALTLSFEGWNTNPDNGSRGWIRILTYGGRLVENIVQATARDILAYAIVNLESAGYPVVLHVHDEIVSEVKENEGSIIEFENIMSTLPSWATGWPIRATEGWRGKRYRK